MSVAARPSKPRDPAFAKPREVEKLDVSAQDRASSMIVALLVILGFIVLIMFAIWLSSRISFNVPLKVTVVEGLGGGGSGNGAPASDQLLEEVSPEEVKDLQEVTPEQTLQAITDAVSTQVVNLEAIEGGGLGLGFGNGEGTGTGDGRGPGPGGPGTATKLPDWEVRFNATTIELYAAQLDFFGIELGAIGGGKKTVDYASKFAQPNPVTRSAPGDAEKRRYLVWRKGKLADADKSLLQKAKIDTNGRVILQFLPEQVELQMRALEAEHAKGKRLDEIRRTAFGVKPVGGGYEFFVAEQDYR
jgi:hypothetical protein